MGILGEGLDALIRARKASQAEIENIAKGLVIGGGAAGKTGGKVARGIKGAAANGMVDTQGLAFPKAAMMGDNGGPPLVEAIDVIKERARQMGLPKANRTQPSGQNPLFSMTPQDYERTKTLLPQYDLPQPRVGSPDELIGSLERSRQLVDNAPAIAARIAEKVQPFKGTEVQYFYNMGPVYEKLRADGLSHDASVEWLRKFGKAYAGTSPRTNTEQNLRNAFLLLNKNERGVPFANVEGPGTAGMSGKEGLSEKGYPMMDFHRDLTTDFLSGTDRMGTNPKPTNFAEGSAGNLKSVTADTHAIRGALIALNDIQPGTLHPEWFKTPEHYSDYLTDPMGWMANADNLAGGLNDTMRSRTRNKVKEQVEYGVLADLYNNVASAAGVEPAEAQSLGWFATGDNTNLASEAKSIPRLLDDRIDVTANAMGISKDQVWKLLQQFKIPLLGVGGAAVGAQNGLLSQDPRGQY